MTRSVYRGGSNGGWFQYTGQLWLEDAGGYYYKNRTYHAELGVFMQTDSIGQSGGINLYAYVGNDPVNFTDPWGLFEVPTGPVDCDTTNCGPQPDLPDRMTVIGSPPYWNQSLAGDDLREFLNNLSPPVVMPDEVITITGTRGGGDDREGKRSWLDCADIILSAGPRVGADLKLGPIGGLGVEFDSGSYHFSLLHEDRPGYWTEGSAGGFWLGANGASRGTYLSRTRQREDIGRPQEVIHFLANALAPSASRHFAGEEFFSGEYSNEASTSVYELSSSNFLFGISIVYQPNCNIGGQ